MGIKAGKGIKAGWGIEAGWGIKAGKGIEAGERIKAGKGIEAGKGITLGLSLSCKGVLSVGLRICAGVCWWRNLQSGDNKVYCGKLESGVVAFGELVETGIKEVDTVKIGGVVYAKTDIEDALKDIKPTS